MKAMMIHLYKHIHVYNAIHKAGSTGMTGFALALELHHIFITLLLRGFKNEYSKGSEENFLSIPPAQVSHYFEYTLKSVKILALSRTGLSLSNKEHDEECESDKATGTQILLIIGDFSMPASRLLNE